MIFGQKSESTCYAIMVFSDLAEAIKTFTEGKNAVTMPKHRARCIAKCLITKLSLNVKGHKMHLNT